MSSADIIIATPAFIARAHQDIQNSIKDLFDHVYFDEAHHVAAREWNVLKSFKDYVSIKLWKDVAHHVCNIVYNFTILISAMAVYNYAKLPKTLKPALETCSS